MGRTGCHPFKTRRPSKVMRPVALLIFGLALGCTRLPTAPNAPAPSHDPTSALELRNTSAVTTREQDKQQLLKAHRDMYRAMLGAEIERLRMLLDDGFSLTHMTGYRQPKREWLAAIESGKMRYHATEEKSVAVNLHGDHAVVVDRSVVTATIYGSSDTWNLQLTTDYERTTAGWIALRTVATTF